ncbi:hypothetical protein MJO29_016477 [Puccinia striiformis f. sp. tritici]|nr:hypothetical protein MJO29_016477 [Puccinia striiformis f. sp. tritici]
MVGDSQQPPGVKPLKSDSCVNVCASSSNVPITAIDPVNVKIDITLNDRTRSINIPIAQRRMKFDQIEWCEPFFKTYLKKWSFGQPSSLGTSSIQGGRVPILLSNCRKYQHHHHQLQQLVLGDIQVYPKKDTITFSSGLHSWASSLRQFSKSYAKKFDDKDKQDGNGFNPHIDAQNYESCSSSSSTTSSSSNDEDDQRTVPANNQYQDAIATKIQRFEQSLNNVLDDHYWSTFFFIDPSPIHPHSNLSIDYQSPKPNHISVSLRKKLKHWVTQMAGQLRHIRTWKSY